MENGTSRREFLSAGALAGLTFWVGSRSAKGDPAPNQKLRIACIGVGGRGHGNVNEVRHEQLVALCDVDTNMGAGAFNENPDAKRYQDFRKMLDELHGQLDAVVVATPDHTHAIATMWALKYGLNVYCEKPLTRTVHEARAVMLAAREAKVATQMGNQGSAASGQRDTIEIVQAGAIGKVTEAHVWTNRPIWPQGIERPTDTPAVPANIDWDVWLGPSPARPYHPAYHPFAWRGWWDFGTGAIGDMACHIANMPFHALKIGYPTSVEGFVSGKNAETAPKSSIVVFEFPARGDLPALRMFWYDGGNKPSRDLVGGRELGAGGSILLGDKGVIMAGEHGEIQAMLPEKDFEGYEKPPQTLPRSPGHHQEWINACKGGPPAQSNFDHGCIITEVFVLGTVAQRLGRQIKYDGAKMEAPGDPEANALIRPRYREGWQVEKL